MTFDAIPAFKRDLKQLVKRYRSLESDLAVVKQVLTVFPNARPPFSFAIEGLGIATPIIKVKKMACQSLKGRGVQTGLRLVYAYEPEQGRITLIELYHKSDQSNEDRSRILLHFG
jgi:mRNA-degrading endonuclease RelE of RelBE toxin-antitoxin system